MKQLTEEVERLKRTLDAVGLVTGLIVVIGVLTLIVALFPNH